MSLLTRIKRNPLISTAVAVAFLLSTASAIVVNFGILDDCIVTVAEAEEMIRPLEVRQIDAEIRQLDREVYAIELLEGDNLANSRDVAMKGKLLREMEDLKTEKNRVLSGR